MIVKSGFQHKVDRSKIFIVAEGEARVVRVTVTVFVVIIIKLAP